MKKIVSIIFGSKFSLLKPKKANILLYDQGMRFNYLFIKTFKNLKFEIFYKRFEKINLYILFLTIFRNGLKNLKQNYLIDYIKSVDPKIVVTSNDVDPRFYKIKNHLKKIKTIAIQRNFKEKREFDLFKSSKEKYSSDFVLLFSLSQKKYFEKHIKSKFIEIGSFSNNYYKKNRLKKKQIILISQFILNFENKKQFFHEKKVIKFLMKYCEKNKIKLKILLKNLSNYNFDHYMDVKSAKIYKNYFNFINTKSLVSQTKTKTNYNYLDENLMVIFMDSALGFECLSRGNKTLRIPLNKKGKDVNNLLLGKMKYDTHFLTNYSRFVKKLNQVKDYNRNLYLKKFNCKDLIHYDENNKTLKKIIKNIIK